MIRHRNSSEFVFLTLIASLLFAGLLEPPLRGQNLFSRYHQDQPHQQVDIGQFQTLGERRGNALLLSERDAIEMALRNNLDINVQRYDTIFSLWESQTQRGIYDPTTRLGLDWSRDKTPTGSVLAGGPSLTDVLTNYDFGYHQEFSTGTSFDASFSGIRNRTTNFFSSVIPSINTSFQLAFTQNLLQGFRRIEQDYRIEIARNNYEISLHDFKQSVLDQVLSVQQSYWELEYAREDIAVKEKSLELANTILEQNRARLEVGSAARLEVIEAEAEVASRQEELIRARFSYQLAQDQLVTRISSLKDPRQLGLVIEPTELVTTPAFPGMDFESMLEEAAQQRPDLQRILTETKNHSLNLQISRNRLKPTLDLVLSYRQFGLGGNRLIQDFSGGFTNPILIDIIPGGLGDSLEQLFSAEFRGYTLGVNFQMPIFNTEARANNARAQIALDRSRLQEDSLRQQVALQIRDALTQIEMNQARITASEAAVRFARERLAGEEAKFGVGMGTTRELIEAQRDLVQAESVLLRARIDLIQSHHQLDRAVGRSLAKLSIRIEDTLGENVSNPEAVPGRKRNDGVRSQKLRVKS